MGLTSAQKTGLDALVAEAYNNMVENGYESQFKDDDFIKVEDLAADMQRCDSDIEKYGIEDIEAAVRRLAEGKQ